MNSRTKTFVLLAALILWMSHSYAQTPAPVTNPTGSAAAAPTTQPSEVVTNQPAVPTTEVPSPAEPPHSQEQVQWALGVSMLIEYLKKSKYFPFLRDRMEGNTLAVVGFLSAVCTTIGINMSINGSFWSQQGLDVTFAHVSWVTFKEVAWQWIAQQGWYLAVVKKAQEVGGFSKPVNA